MSPASPLVMICRSSRLMPIDQQGSDGWRDEQERTAVKKPVVPDGVCKAWPDGRVPQQVLGQGAGEVVGHLDCSEVRSVRFPCER